MRKGGWIIGKRNCRARDIVETSPLLQRRLCQVLFSRLFPRLFSTLLPALREERPFGLAERALPGLQWVDCFRRRLRRCSRAGLSREPHSFVAERCSERPGAVKGAFGAAQRTLDGEDRSETIPREGMARLPTLLQSRSLPTNKAGIPS